MTRPGRPPDPPGPAGVDEAFVRGGDPHDRGLVRAALRVPPADRLAGLAAGWPSFRVGLAARRAGLAAGGTPAAGLRPPVPVSAEPDRFAPLEVLGGLHRGRVAYVLVGPAAAVVLGAPLLTAELTLVPDPATTNRQRLAAALRALGAVRYGGPDQPPTDPDPADLLEPLVHYAAPDGLLDAVRELPAVGGYASLVRHAHRRLLAGVPVRVAALPDLLAAAKASRRVEEAALLPALQALRAELGVQAGDRQPGFG
jgi:hypothetical protein